MDNEGPPLESLTRRLAETPEDFLAEPRLGNSGRVHVAAVVNDLAALLGGRVDAHELAAFDGQEPKADRNRLAITLLLCWLLSDDWFRQAHPPVGDVLRLLKDETRQLAGQVASRKFTTDPDRREELVRTALARLAYRPAGESKAQAQDRLTSLSSTERARVMQAARVAEERARSIREALAKKAAQESADKWTRE
jgi:hypothetical protein